MDQFSSSIQQIFNQTETLTAVDERLKVCFVNRWVFERSETQAVADLPFVSPGELFFPVKIRATFIVEQAVNREGPCSWQDLVLRVLHVLDSDWAEHLLEGLDGLLVVAPVAVEVHQVGSVFVD